MAGGQAKADGLDPVLAHVSSVKKAYLIGASAAEFADSLAGHCPAIICHDLDNATRTEHTRYQRTGGGARSSCPPAVTSVLTDLKVLSDVPPEEEEDTEIHSAPTPVACSAGEAFYPITQKAVC